MKLRETERNSKSPNRQLKDKITPMFYNSVINDWETNERERKNK